MYHLAIPRWMSQIKLYSTHNEIDNYLRMRFFLHCKRKKWLRDSNRSMKRINYSHSQPAPVQNKCKLIINTSHPNNIKTVFRCMLPLLTVDKNCNESTIKTIVTRLWRIVQFYLVTFSSRGILHKTTGHKITNGRSNVRHLIYMRHWLALTSSNPLKIY